MKAFALIFIYIMSANLFANELEYSDLQHLQKQASFNEVTTRFEIMIKDKQLMDFFSIHPDRLEVFSDETKANLEFTYHFGSGNKNTPSRSSVSGLKVLIDPGHVGGDFAYQEGRFIEMLYNPLITFKEGDIALHTAQHLQDLLTSQGAIVKLSREVEGRSGENVLFEDFVQDQAMIAEAIDLVSENALDKHWWRNNTVSKKYLGILFTKYDYRMRAKRAREFAPELSISIHYNACFPGKVKVVDQGKTYYRDRQTNRNYHMVFVPGAFMKGELKHKRKRVQLVRWLVSGKIEDSIALAHHLMDSAEIQTNVNAVSDIADLDYLNDFRTASQVSDNLQQNYLRRSSLAIGTENGTDLLGVFARNLYVTHYPGVVLMGETFCQEGEHLNLFKKDTKVRGVPTSSRVKDVAEAYFEAIKKWVKDPLIQFEKL
jgi:N-acetylmuramoyl-L-alanine amidase